MREIEIKVRADNLDGIRAQLDKKGAKLSAPVMQHDVVWGPKEAKSGTNVPWLRLRTETKQGEATHLFTLKRSVTGQLDSIEHETEVSDPSAVEGIVHELGFTLYSDITKTRQKARFGDIELCLDSVDDLGDFIEAEKLTEETADYQAAADELWALFEDFGVPRDSEVTGGYDVLINKKLGKE